MTKKHGQGTYTWSNGDEYVGEWKNGKISGQGTYTFADGSQYAGEFKDDKFHGKGTHTWPSGNQYVGVWKDGKKHGQGTITFADGSQYAGELKDDKFHGKGTHTWPSGNKYVGEFKDNNFHGQGLCSTSQGSYTCHWINGGLQPYKSTGSKVGQFIAKLFVQSLSIALQVAIADAIHKPCIPTVNVQTHTLIQKTPLYAGGNSGLAVPYMNKRRTTQHSRVTTCPPRYYFLK